MKKAVALTVALVILAVVLSQRNIQLVPRSSASGETSVQQPRRVQGQTLTSAHLPAVQIKFDQPFKYAGNQSFILYDVANAEQHFFVDADKEGRIKRMYWVQFEGYLPSNTHSYKYKPTKLVDVGGLEFIADAYAVNFTANPARAGSDGSRARSFLESRGYRMASDDVLMQRLVNLIGADKRNELMIIYLEDLRGMQLTAADFAKDGRAVTRWDEVSKGLLQRAVEGLRIRRS